MKKMIWIAAVCGAAAVIVALAVFLYVRNQAAPAHNNMPITSFYYSHSGSSTGEIYSYGIGADEESGETKAWYEFNNGNEMYSLPVDEELLKELTAIVDDHSLYKWDGFNKTNSMVLDGSGFFLIIDFEDGTQIMAHGSNSYPKGYDEAVEAIEGLFLGYLRKNGIEPEGGF